MGMRVRLRASFDISGYPPPAQVVLRALKKYGMIVADNGSDFFLSGTPDNMTVTETTVHKINGKALYSWKEEGGVWKKMPAA